MPCCRAKALRKEPFVATPFKYLHHICPSTSLTHSFTTSVTDGLTYIVALAQSLQVSIIVRPSQPGT